VRWVRALGLAAALGTALGILLGVLKTPEEFVEPEEAALGALAPLKERKVSETESGVPGYTGQALKSFTEDMKVQGVPMSTGWFVAPDPIETVQLYYEKRISEAGLPMVSERFPSGLGYVGYRESVTNLMHVVTLVPQADEQTMVFVSTSSSQEMLKSLKDTKVPAELPHPSEAKNTTVMSAGVGDVSQRWVTAQVMGKPLSKLYEFYLYEFVKAGWSLSEHRVDPSGANAWVQAERGPLQAQISLRDDKLGKAGPAIQIFSMLSEKAPATAVAKSDGPKQEPAASSEAPTVSEASPENNQSL